MSSKRRILQFTPAAPGWRAVLATEADDVEFPDGMGTLPVVGWAVVESDGCSSVEALVYDPCARTQLDPASDLDAFALLAPGETVTAALKTRAREEREERERRIAQHVAEDRKRRQEAAAAAQESERLREKQRQQLAELRRAQDAEVQPAKPVGYPVPVVASPAAPEPPSPVLTNGDCMRGPRS